MVAKTYTGDFHFRVCLNDVDFEYDNYPTLSQGMKTLFKNENEKEIRDLVLENTGKGMYRCMVDIWY